VFASGRRWRRLLAAATTAAIALSTPLTAYADGTGSGSSTPSTTAAEKSRELEAAKAQAAADKQKLAAAQNAVVSAQQQLAALAQQARAAIQRYEAAMRKLNRAKAAAALAHAALLAAAADVARHQQEVDAVVRTQYMSGGPINAVAAVLSDGGPTVVLDKTTTLDQLSRTQARVLHDLAIAKQWQATVSAQADAAMAAVAKMAAKADATRRTAMSAVDAQHSLVTNLTTQQIDVAKQLAAHTSQVAKLTKEQKAAAKAAREAAERAALAAAWVAMQGIGDAMPWATPAQGRDAVARAKSQLGVPYSWGGGNANGPTLGFTDEDGNTYALHTVGFDCSGLALYAWAGEGFKLDHFTGYQWVEGHHVSLDQLRPGDLVFFATDVSDPLTIHHVGIYVGGDRMIDAPHHGANVRYDNVFVPGLIGAVRP